MKITTFRVCYLTGTISLCARCQVPNHHHALPVLGSVEEEDEITDDSSQIAEECGCPCHLPLVRHTDPTEPEYQDPRTRGKLLPGGVIIHAVNVDGDVIYSMFEGDDGAWRPWMPSQPDFWNRG